MSIKPSYTILKSTFWCLLFTSCSFGLLSPSQQNSSWKYETSSLNMPPMAKVFHFSADSSVIYLIAKSNIFLLKDVERAKVRIKIKARFYHSLSDLKPIDSIILPEKEYTLEQNKDLNFEIKYSNTEQKDLFAEIIFENSLKPDFNKTFVRLSRFDIYGDQFYLAKKNEMVLHQAFVNVGDSIKLEALFGPMHENYLVQYVYQDSNFTIPPKIGKTKITLEPLKEGGKSKISKTEFIQFDSIGYYHIKTDLDENHGILIYCFEKGFPQLSSEKAYLEPLQFLIKEKEYKQKQELLPTVGMKVVEDFWLDAGGNQKKAQRLMSEYYQRVQYANSYFTSIKDGWKTDRGMLFILAGKPDRLFLYDESEIWMYDNFLPEGPLEIRFKKEKNNYSSNHFIFEKTFDLDKIWNFSVERWKMGHIIKPCFD